MSHDSRKEIFDSIKPLIQHYVPPLVATSDFDSRYEVVSKKQIEIEGRKKDEVYFAGLIIQSTYVGFYFMPIYVDTDMKKVFDKELLNMLKGKSCFHIKHNEIQTMKQITNALEKGFTLYKNRGWV